MGNDVPYGGYIVFAPGRHGGAGNGDLYVSFRDSGSGQWSEPALLGNGINSEDTDYCPMVTPDGRYLFFFAQDQRTAGGQL